MVNKSVLKYKTSQANKKNTELRVSTGFSQAKNLGILFTVEDEAKHQRIKDFIQYCKDEGKEVTVLCYLPAGKDNFEFLFDFFTKKEISFWGSFKNPAIESFLKNEYDFVFAFDVEINTYLSNILANSKARCRVGYSSERNQKLLEFMIKPDKQNAVNLITETERYIKKLKG